MNNRSAILTYPELVSLDTYCRCTQIVGEVSKSEIELLDPVFYANIFQSGVDEIIALSDQSLCQNISNNIKNRISFAGLAQSEACLKIIEYFEEHRHASEKDEKVNTSIHFLQGYLCSIATGMALKKPVITVQPKPNLKALEGFLPSGLIQSFHNFFSTVISEDCHLPVPKEIISAEDYERLEEIITSKIFTKYEEAHLRLDDLEQDHRLSIKEIGNQTLKLSSIKHRSLISKKSAISLLNISPKLIDAVFGKLPGVLANIFGELGISALNNKKRTIIYDCNQICEDHFRLQLKNQNSANNKINRTENTEVIL